VGPIGHVGIALPAGRVLRLNLPIVFLCALLPDLVDKSLWALGIGGGRYIAHTLLFVFVIAGVLFLWRRVYGLSALLGIGSHLLLDIRGFIPWFYPFVSYDFPKREFAPSHFFSNLVDLLHNNLTLSRLGEELIWVISVCAAAFLCLWLYSRFSKRRQQRDGRER
jgi:hypothetical protein